MDRLSADTNPDPHAKAERIAALETEFLAAFPEACEADDALATSTGHPVLAEGSRWGDLARESGAPDAARKAGELVENLLEDEARRWREIHREGRGEPDPTHAFRDLADLRAFDLEALGRRSKRPPLRDDLPAYRERFLESLRTREPTPKERRDWVTELLDRANVTRTSADEMTAGRAQASLALVRNDLEWHARNIEAKGRRRTRLLIEVRRLRAERQDRFLQSALQKRFGANRVRQWNRMIFWLILLVIALLGWEIVYWLRQPGPESDWPASWQRNVLWMHRIDTAACFIFLADFFTRLWLVRGRVRWFARHLITDFLPSIPGLHSIRWLRGVRVFRYLRLVRVFGFFTRGIDSLVRRYGALLNRNVVLYPTREERALASRSDEGLGIRVRRLQTRINMRWHRLLTTSLHVDREQIALTRVDALEAVRANGFDIDPKAIDGHRAARDLTADELLHDLASLSPESLEATVGQDFVARVARGIRLLSLRPVRWIPFIRRYVPRLSPSMTDAETVVAGARSASKELQRHHRRWFWFADLYGTVTPAQFVDRVGTTMFKASLRPAYRLAIFGLGFLLAKTLIDKFDVGILEGVKNALERILGSFLIVLGSIAAGTLLVGWWLRNLAGQATDFFAQSARAQFLDLTEAIKGRAIERDAAIFDRHIFGPERLVHGQEEGPGEQIRFTRGVRAWLIEAQPGDGITRGFDPVERTAILYRDSMDGALFVRNDTRTIRQLLGNPALRTMRLLSSRYTLRRQRDLIKLDLDQSRVFLRGPYFWFSLTCQAVAHGVARLIVDYNRHCLPLDQLEAATPEERLGFENWLTAGQVADVATERVLYVTTQFTALHFLDDDPKRDEEVAVRFGDAVRDRMMRDRRNLIRRVFGTYPLHSRPRDQRMVNLYAIYQSWFAGGRSLLLPFRLAGLAIGFFARIVGWLIWCIREIRSPSFEVDAEAVRGADYETATRKIWRMRGPVAEAILHKRAVFDPEYLGLALPGEDASGLEDANVWTDLEFLRSDPETRKAIETDHRRAAADLVRLGRLLQDGLQKWTAEQLGVAFTREHLRAAALAYVSDMRGARSLLSASELLVEIYDRASRHQHLPWQWWPRPALWLKFHRYWRDHGVGGWQARRAAWRATKHDHEGVRGALLAFDEYGHGSRSVGEQALLELLRHPERLTDQLVTLRAVQTLSLIDVLNYREHVFRLGRYAEDGDDPGTTLTLH